MNKIRRYLIRQLIHTNNVHLATITHELYRVATVEKTGLTEKERAFLAKRVETLKVVGEDLTRLGNKVQRDLNHV